MVKKASVSNTILVQVILIAFIMAMFLFANAGKINGRGVKQEIIESQLAMLIEASEPGMTFAIEKLSADGVIDNVKIENGKVYVSVDGFKSVKGKAFFSRGNGEWQWHNPVTGEEGFIDKSTEGASYNYFVGKANDAIKAYSGLYNSEEGINENDISFKYGNWTFTAVSPMMIISDKNCVNVECTIKDDESFWYYTKLGGVRVEETSDKFRIIVL